MKLKTYQEAREYLESFIRPMLFRKITLVDGKEADPLDRMRVLLELLGNPQGKFPSVVVSGTAGKGSTAYLLSHILSTAGNKTGLSLSPHLQKITERMQLNNHLPDDSVLVSLVNEVVPVIEKMKVLPIGEPSYFEILLALAFLYFAREKVDIAIIEVGIEGKYDATQVLSPLTAILTNIELDHTEILGETVEAIAEEAVSIVRSDLKTLITGVKQDSVNTIIVEKSQATGTNVLRLGHDFTYEIKQSDRSGSVFSVTVERKTYEDIFLSLVGKHQVENATLAITATKVLNHFPVPPTQLRKALRTAFFPGRFEQVSYKGKTIILDGAHNPVKMEAFIASLEQLYPEQKKIFVVTFKKGKQAKEMLGIIARSADQMILTEFHRTIDTSKNASSVVSDIEAVWNDVNVNRTPTEHTDTATGALHSAVREADEDSLIVVTGSLYLVGEIKDLIDEN